MSSGRWAVLLGCLIVFCAALAGVAPAQVASAATTAPRATMTPTMDDRDPWIRLDQLPATLNPAGGDSITVTVIAGADPIPAGWSVMLTVQPRPLTTRTAVANWRSGSLEGSVGVEAARVPIAEAIPAGQGRQLSIPVGAAGGLDVNVWGPRGAAVLLLDDHNDTRRALTRTFLIAGTQPVIAEPPKITVLLPITPHAISVDTGLAERSTLPDIGPGGRLDRLRELGTRPGVVPVLDPAALTMSPDPDAAAAAATDAAAGPAPIEEPLEQWRGRMRESLGAHEVIALPYADPDVVGLQEAKSTAMAELSAQLGHHTLAQSGLNARQDIAVPIDGVAGAGVLGLYSQLGRNGGVVLDADVSPTQRTSRVTATARGQVEVRGKDVPTVVTDPALSAALQATAYTGASGGAAAQQRILADLVVLAEEAPNRQRNIVVIAPRDFTPTDHSVAAIDQLVEGAQTRPASLADLLASAPVDREEPSLTSAQRQTALPAEGIHDVEHTQADAKALASTFTQVEAGSLRTDRVAVSLLSSRWRADPGGWEAARAQFTRWVDEIRNAVRIVPGSTVTQVSRNVRLPVTVENRSDEIVAVQVHVEPSSNRLVVPEPVDVTVPPHSRATGYVPVRGVGNGDTSVRITLQAPSGVQLGEPVVTDVRVRADWETFGTRTIGALAAVVLFIGLVRSIRRGSRASRARAEQQPDGAAPTQPSTPPSGG